MASRVAALLLLGFTCAGLVAGKTHGDVRGRNEQE